MASYMPDRNISTASLMMGGVAITALTLAIVYGYSLYMPPALDLPLIVSIDGVEYPDSYFNESFNYSSIRDKHVLFEVRIEPSEYAPSSSGGQVHKTVYEFTELDEVWSVPESMGAPQVVLNFATWLTNGTHIEVDKRWYGSDYGSDSSAHDIAYNMGGGPDRNAYFVIQRTSIVYEIMYEVSGGEIVSIEKVRSRVGGAGPVWIFAVQLSGPPYKAILVRFP